MAHFRHARRLSLRPILSAGHPAPVTATFPATIVTGTMNLALNHRRTKEKPSAVCGVGS